MKGIVLGLLVSVAFGVGALKLVQALAGGPMFVVTPEPAVPYACDTGLCCAPNGTLDGFCWKDRSARSPRYHEGFL